MCQHFSIDAGIHTRGQSCPHIDGALTGFLVVYCALVETRWVRLLRCSWFTERIYYMRLHILFNTIWIRTGFYLLIYLLWSAPAFSFASTIVGLPSRTFVREKERHPQNAVYGAAVYLQPSSRLQGNDNANLSRDEILRILGNGHCTSEKGKSAKYIGLFQALFLIDFLSSPPPPPHRNTYPFSSVVVYGSRFHSMFK